MTTTVLSPPASAADAAVAVELLPILIEVRGEIVTSNFAAFAAMVRDRLREINRDLANDEHFAQADKDAKAIAAAEEALKAAKGKALADAEELHHLFSQIDILSAELAEARLGLSKQIAKRKEEIKGEIVEEALARFDAIGADLARSLHKPSVVEALKGKRSVESMRKAALSAVSTHLAAIERSRSKLVSFETIHGRTLTMDRRELEVMTADSLDGELRRRADLKKADDERVRLAAEAAQANALAVKVTEKLAATETEEAPIPPGVLGASALPKVSESDRYAVEGLSQSEEWDQFESTIRAVFPPLKEARMHLRYPRNISRAQVFANAMNAAWENR